jgi:transposase InsO family protein
MNLTYFAYNYHLREVGRSPRPHYILNLPAPTHTFCDSCKVCLQNKPTTLQPAGKLHSLPVPTKPWESIAMDFVGLFPKSAGCGYLWVIMCRFTSNVHLIPINTMTQAIKLSRIFVREIVWLHGLPKSIVSDRDSKFTSAWWREVHRLLGAKLLMSTAFHPQMDGATKRANQSIGQMMRSMVRADQKDWMEKIPLIEFAINASISTSTGFSLFELIGGYMPSMLRNLHCRIKYPGGYAILLSAHC